VPEFEPPPIDPTIAGRMLDATAFLYAGTSPVQTGVAPGTITAERVAVVRGRVLDADGTSPKGGVTVTILGHPELGRTSTRADGQYDLAVNGGTTYVVEVSALGYLPVQRHVNVEWHGWLVVDDIVLTHTQSSPDLFVSGSATPQVVRGLVTPAGEDADGARQAVVIFPESTHFTNYAVPDGTPLEVQLTEYTRGPQGPQRMPGELPSTSGYTYAVELGFPAATAAGVTDVQFDRDVPVYVDNFTHYPVGGPVPVGYYDRAKGAWMAEKSGRILKVLSTNGGVASVDVTGAGVAAPGSALSELGITTSELQALASQYAPGQELWRVTVRHFSSWDLNWGFGPPPGAPPPPPPGPFGGDPGDPCSRAGSIIGCESRTLGEEVPIVGTPFKLRYQSNRTEGFRHEVTFPITGAVLPSPLPLRALVQIDVVGRHFEFVQSPLAPDQVFTWTWDGLDPYGRNVTGSATARLRVGYEYPGVTRSTASFGAVGGATITGDRAARTVTLWKEASVVLRRAEAKALGLGGWTLDAHHVVDVEGLTLHRGDGRRRDFGLDAMAVVDTFAGGGSYPNYGDGGPAREAYLSDVNDFSMGADGSLALATDGYNTYGGRVRYVRQDGIITTLAGLPPTTAKVDGALALHALVYPTSIAVGADGTVYFAEANYNQVWKLTPDSNPTLRLVVGTGASSCPTPDCGDGGDARAAQLNNPAGLAVASDGTLFIADSGHQRVRRVGPEGTISTYLQITNYAEDPRGLSLLPDRTLFVRTDKNWLVRIDPTGQAAYMAWIPSWWGGNVFASLYGGIVARSDDSFLMANYSNVLLRTSGGTLLRIAGRDSYGFAGDGGPALSAQFQFAGTLVEGKQQDIFVSANGRVRRIRPSSFGSPFGLTFRVPNEDGSEIYEADLSGRHLRTLSGLKGTPLYTFGYDPTTRQLTSITDAGSNVTSITRTGGQIAITAPHGQVTTLALDAHGYLASVTNPNGELTQLAHSNAGLLTDFVDARGSAHRFEYDTAGRLTKDIDATPGSLGTRLTNAYDANGWTVDITSPEGRLTRHRVDRKGSFGDSTIRERRAITQGGSLATVIDAHLDDSKWTARPDGTKVSVLATAADPRWGVGASFGSSIRTDVGHPTTTHSMTQTESRAATLATFGDLFSISGETVTTTLSGAGLPNATTTSVFAAGPPATWTTTSPAGRQTRRTLDSLERVTQMTVLGTDPVALYPVQYHYDAEGRIDQIVRGSRVFATSYDPTTGWVESTSDPAGLGVSYTARDGNGRPLSMNLPGGRALAMSYDRSGNVVSITPPSKPAHALAWGPTNRTASYAPPDLGFAPKDTAYTYDKDGLLLQLAQPGTPSAFAYDALGRTQRIADVVTKTFAYDPQGRLSSITTSDGVTLTNTYDGSLLAQQAMSGPFSHALNKTYDNFLRVSSWNVDGVGTVSLTYDGDSFVTAAGGMAVTRGNTGLLKSTTLGAVTDAFSYSAYGEVTGHTVTGSATSYVATYTRDAAGRIDTKTETIGGVSHSERYTYDAAGRLWQVFVDGASTPYREWTYDANGNRADGTYDAQDRQLTHEGLSYAYGPNGELAKKTDDATLADTLYSYDARGNLRRVTRPSPLTGIDYVIDGQNRRIGKKVGGALVQGFLYDSARIVAELDAAGAVVSRFVYATDGHSPDVMFKGDATYRFVKDHLGSPRLVVDAATGAIAQRIDYDEWGLVTSDTSPGFQPFGFGGGLWDRDTNLVRFGARDYDPTTGRWTSKDPIRFDGGLNLYGYVATDPVNRIDPLGLADQCYQCPPEIPDCGRCNRGKEACVKSCEKAADDAFDLCYVGGGDATACKSASDALLNSCKARCELCK
jgi:RHS repeat-associated protein